MIEDAFREYIELATGVKTEPLILESILGEHEKRSYDIISAVEGKNKKILALFKEFLQFGYFPYFT